MNEHAKTILDNYWDGNLPVDVIDIGKKLGIKFVPMDATDSDACGMIERKIDGSIVCHLNQSNSALRQRFTVAHEIGHLVTGHLSDTQRMFRDTKFQLDNKYDTKEIQANRFAAALLMPSDAIEYLIEKYADFRTVAALAKAFNVSKDAMFIRLKNLGYLPA